MTSAEQEEFATRAAWLRCLPWVFIGVIVLTTVLVGALSDWHRFPRRGQRASACLTMVVITTAVDEFLSDTGSLPVPAGLPRESDASMDTSTASGLIAILKGLDPVRNPKQIDYLGDIRDAKEKDGRHFDGLVQNGNRPGLVDPWGHPYIVVLDTDNDERILTPATSDEPLLPVKRRVLVYSAGKDGDPATWRDNVASWD